MRTTPTTSCAVYVRISQDKEGAGLGVARQEEDCREVADALGLTVDQVYVDNDISAYSGKVRPAYQRMLKDVADRRFHAIVAWHTDRLHRSTRELEDFIEVLRRAGDIPVHTVKAGLLDLSTPAGRAVAKTLGAWAQYESEHKSERIKRKARQNAESGREVGGGTRPFGYDHDRKTIREDEAEMIRWAAREVVLGASLGSICRAWNDGGKLPVSGKEWTVAAVQRLVGQLDQQTVQPDHLRLAERVQKALDDGSNLYDVMVQLNQDHVPPLKTAPWSRHVLRRMLLSPRVAGLASYHGSLIIRDDQPVQGEWPGIIDTETHMALRAILEDPARQTNGGKLRRTYLLTGLLVCGICGSKMQARPQQKLPDGTRQPSYVCGSPVAESRGCGRGRLRIKGQEVEDLVVNAWLDRMTEDNGPVPVWPDDANPEYLQAIARTLELQMRISTANEARFLHGELDRSEHARIVGRLNEELDEARQQAVRTAGAFATPLPKDRMDLLAEWNGESFAWRQHTLGQSIRKVVVARARRGYNRFDPSRVTIDWR